VSPERIDQRALGRATLARQHLLERTDGQGGRGVVAMVRHLVGLQAQAPWSPYLALLARLDDVVPDDVGGLIERRSLVRTPTLRGTIHLSTPADAAAIRPHLQPLFDRQLTSQKKRREQLAGVDIDAVAEAGAAVMASEALTPTELGERLAERFEGVAPEALAMVVRNRVHTVQVPPRAVWGKQGPPRLTSLEAWVAGGPVPEEPPQPMPLDELVRRHLAAYGPSTVKDVQTWSGLTRLAEVVADLGTELVRFTGEDGAELLDLPDAPRPSADVDAPPRLLPDFDEVLLAHADRRRIVPSAHRVRIASRNGMPPATVLIDGRVAGTWRQERSGRRGGDVGITVETWGPLPRSERPRMEEEALRLLDLVAPDTGHDVRIMRA
jgi:hypothetical protein